MSKEKTKERIPFIIFIKVSGRNINGTYIFFTLF